MNPVYEKILRNALGEHWYQQRAVGEKILDYLIANPDWDKVPCIDFDREWEIFSECVLDVLGQPIEFYLKKCREHWLVDIRRMLVVVYRMSTRRSLSEMNEKFRLDHATIVHHQKTWRDKNIDRELIEQYIKIKTLFLKRIEDEKNR